MGTFLGLVATPLAWVAPSLQSAYLKIGMGPIPSMITSAVVAVVLLAVLLGIALVRLGLKGRGVFDHPFSPWRSVKWAAILYVAAYWLSIIPPGLLTIRIGRINPEFYEHEKDPLGALRGPWTWSVWLAFGIAAIIVIIDVLAVLIRADRRKEDVLP